MPAHVTFRARALRPFVTILIDFGILQQQLSMMAFSCALVLVLGLRWAVEGHSGKVLAPGSEYE